MFVPSHALDVVPGSGLMASVALVDLGSSTALRNLRIFLTRDPFGDHLEMHHAVAGRSLMALRALARVCRRMLELREGPLRGGVAACAL